MSANKLIKNTSKTVSKQNVIYSNKYTSSGKRQSKSIELWDKRGKFRFVTRAEYLNTTKFCSPILRIQFMASKDQKNQNCFDSGKFAICNCYVESLQKLNVINAFVIG